VRRDRGLAQGRPSTAVAALTVRRATRSGAVWGAVFGLYVVASASGYASAYPTAASRAKLVRSLGANPGLAALLGPARHLETVAGFTAWRTLGVLTIAGAVWGMLLATRLLRGEEEAGRWELLLAGPTTRGRAATQAIVGLGAGLVALWVVTAMFAVADGSASNVNFSAGDALFLATALVAGGAVFLAVGAVASELAATRRQANGLAACVLGASFVVRMVADSGAGLTWLRWASPLGWAEELRPLTDPRPVILLPILALVAVLATMAIRVASGRDLGAGALARPETAPAHVHLLGGPTGLVLRLMRPVAVGWIAGLATLGVVLGLVAQSASTAISGSKTLLDALARLGGHRGGAASYLGVALLTAAALVAFAAAGQVAATRAEEADGRLDHLLARPVGRTRWLAGRAALAAGLIVAASLATGLGSWLGAASQRSGVGIGELLQAGLNIAPPALLVLGVGLLAYGLAPRRSGSTTWWWTAPCSPTSAPHLRPTPAGRRRPGWWDWAC
jgi:ABC-2 type transport system permease protein